MIDLLRLIYPNTCLVCGKKIPFSQNRGLCATCDKLFGYRAYLKTVSVDYKSGNTVKTRKILVASPFSHADKIRKKIYNYKFNNKKALARLFACEMLNAFSKAKDTQHFDAVTYIPLSKHQKTARGYDQSFLLAKYFAKFSKLPIETLLQKVRENEAQHTLSAEKRKTNVIGVYACKDMAKIKGKSVILCDDITTTGSTLIEGCRMLFESGAKDIICVTATQGVLT